MKRGRNDELQRVYRANVQAVFAFFAYSVSADIAEDLTASTFERVIRSFDRFDSQRASERTWILAIARNILIDHYRRQRVRDAVSTDEHPHLLDRLLHIDDSLGQQLRAEETEGWFRHLSEREREVLALRFGADLSASDVGAAMGLSEANVHQIVSRALRRLRRVVPVKDSS